jgi:hypothetical protein
MPQSSAYTGENITWRRVWFNDQVNAADRKKIRDRLWWEKEGLNGYGRMASHITVEKHED